MRSMCWLTPRCPLDSTLCHLPGKPFLTITNWGSPFTNCSPGIRRCSFLAFITTAVTSWFLAFAGGLQALQRQTQWPPYTHCISHVWCFTSIWLNKNSKSFFKKKNHFPFKSPVLRILMNFITVNIMTKYIQLAVRLRMTNADKSHQVKFNLKMGTCKFWKPERPHSYNKHLHWYGLYYTCNLSGISPPRNTTTNL